MNHKIKIKHFLLLKNITLEIRDLNLLIGEQASGKSTVCKTIFLFKCFKNIFRQFFIEVLRDEDKTCNQKEMFAYFNKESKELFIKFFGSSFDLDRNTEVVYYYSEDKFITMTINKEGYLGFQLSDKLKDDISFMVKTIRRDENKKTENKKTPFYFFDQAFNVSIYEKFSKELNLVFHDDSNMYYMPAGRNMFALLRSQLASLRLEMLDYTNEMFFHIVENFSQLIKDGPIAFAKREQSSEGLKIAENIFKNLGGEYRYNGEGAVFATKDTENKDVYIQLKHISSGQQEVMWIFYLLFIWLIRREKTFLIIEEPEAHIHPTLQYEVMKFIAYYVNKTKSQVILTTHSPYILASANVLRYAGGLNRRKIAQNVVSKDESIDPSKSSFREMRKDKNKIELHTLCDDEDDFIQAERIDYISEEIDEKFSKLISVDEGQ